MIRLRSILTAFFLALLVALLPAASAYADAGDEAGQPKVFVVSAPVIMTLVGIVIPVLNGLLTKANTSGTVKGVLTIVLTAVGTLLVNATVADGTGVFTSQVLFTWAYTTVIAIVSYVGVWKPANVTSNEGGKLANVGIK